MDSDTAPCAGGAAGNAARRLGQQMYCLGCWLSLGTRSPGPVAAAGPTRAAVTAGPGPGGRGNLACPPLRLAAEPAAAAAGGARTRSHESLRRGRWASRGLRAAGQDDSPWLASCRDSYESRWVQPGSGSSHWHPWARALGRRPGPPPPDDMQFEMRLQSVGE